MKKNPNWEIREKVVALIEQHLGKNSKVQHNIKLPVLKSEKRNPRQCDIVITQGEPPRQTISIAEVQKRGSKPDINTFNGWVEKMKEVGAQHLLCISEVGFPDSIEERADELGPSVRLLTIKQLEKGEWPIPPIYFSSEMKRVRYEQLVGLEWEHVHLIRQDPKTSKALPSPFEKILQFDSGSQFSITDLMDLHLFKSDKSLDELPVRENIPLIVRFNWKFEEAPSMKTPFQGLVKVKWLKVNFRLSIFIDNVEWATESYEQYKWGELAWCLTGKSDSGAHIVVPLHRESPGNYRLGRLISMNDMQAFLSVDSRGYKAAKFDL